MVPQYDRGVLTTNSDAMNKSGRIKMGARSIDKIMTIHNKSTRNFTLVYLAILLIVANIATKITIDNLCPILFSVKTQSASLMWAKWEPVGQNEAQFNLYI